MKHDWIHSHVFGDMTALWRAAGASAEFTLVPAGMEGKIPAHRRDTNDEASCRGIRAALGCDWLADGPVGAIQPHIVGDADAHGFAAGLSMREGEGSWRLRGLAFEDLPDGVRMTIEDPDRGLAYCQEIRQTPGERFVRVSTSVTNRGDREVTLEHLDSFSLGMLSPFRPDDAPGAIEILRWRSGWSNEGRPDFRLAEDLGLERSWNGSALRILRFGENGSMPVRGFAPLVGLRDRKARVVWGAAIDSMASWQAEVTRRQDFYNISGGWVDAEFGGWRKTLRPGETYTAPSAAVTCARGDAQTLQNRLVGFGQGPVLASEADLPILFNDWCTTWGRPFPENLSPIADKLRTSGIRYFMLDLGWFMREDGSHDIGDWIPHQAYRGGIRQFLDSLRARGYVPGVWFEFEVATTWATIFRGHPDWMLQKDGKPYISGCRAFLDFRKREVVDYLAEKVIEFLRDNGVGYMKVDYNAPIGQGIDGAESPSEALRQHTEAVRVFYERITRELPDLVLEICASGGHRLSAPWMRMSSMASFSDAHEGVEIPVVAANVAGLIPARKSQIWAVLHPSDDEDRIRYLLAGGFLGRLCLSGDIAGLSAAQMRLVERACALYRKASAVIADGDNRVYRRIGATYLHPRGWQAVVRSGAAGRLAVVHTFAGAPGELRIDLGGGAEHAAKRARRRPEIFAPRGVSVSIEGDTLAIGGLKPFQAVVALC